MILFQLRPPRGKSLESLEDPNERVSGSHLTFIRQTDPMPYYNTHQTSMAGMIVGNSSSSTNYHQHQMVRYILNSPNRKQYHC